MKIGEFLLKKGLISSDQLEEVLKEHKVTNVRIGDILVQKGIILKEQMIPLLSEYFNLPIVHLKDIYKDISPDVTGYIPKELAYELKVVPIDKKEDTLVVAIIDPLDIAVIDTLRIKTGLRIEYVMALETDILDAIEYCYHGDTEMKKQIESFIDLELEDGEEQETSHSDEHHAEDPPVVTYVKSLIIQAVNNNVSDILLQPKEKMVDLRFRVDGILYDREPPPLGMIAAIISRIKIISSLNIAEKRVPQDGRFKILIGNREVDVRVSTIPTIYGESVVMRLLNAASILLTLNDLGFREREQEKYKSIINKGYGLILVTGPTGSGKTTTLYSSLNEIQSRSKHIITMEDPVEYRLSSVTQSQVNVKVGYSFSHGLRSILRQSPDVILVGEIRDRETAEIGIHAALTGHLVFSTLHTNDAASTAIRLINMGCEPYLISSCLLGVLAQRLIRIICPHCKEEVSNQEIRNYNLIDAQEVQKIYKGKGCDQCFDTGYKGRRAIYELMIPNEEIAQLIIKRNSAEEVKSAATRNGMITLRQNALELLKDGMTTLEEVVRLTQETQN